MRPANRPIILIMNNLKVLGHMWYEILSLVWSIVHKAKIWPHIYEILCMSVVFWVLSTNCWAVFVELFNTDSWMCGAWAAFILCSHFSNTECGPARFRRLFFQIWIITYVLRQEPGRVNEVCNSRMVTCSISQERENSRKNLKFNNYNTLTFVTYSTKYT